MQDTIQKIRQAIRFDTFVEDGADLSITVDRYRRHDHGGGEDGDDWLDDSDVDDDFRQGVSEHGNKLTRVNEILKEDGFKPNAHFDLGEKGHFAILVTLQKA